MSITVDFPLKDDFFALQNPTGHQFGDPAFNGMRVPLTVRNLILESQQDIIMPARLQKVHSGKQTFFRTLPEQRVTRWRLISSGDLAVDVQETPAPSQSNPTPDQIIQWVGTFEISYYISNIGPTTIHDRIEAVIKVFPNVQLNLNAYLSDGVYMLIWNLPGNLEYLPGCLLDEPGSQIDWNFVTWFSGIPDFSADPYTAHLHYNSARLGCKWDS